MASLTGLSSPTLTAPPPSSSPSLARRPILRSPPSLKPPQLSLRCARSCSRHRISVSTSARFVPVAAAGKDPLKVIISGAPASGKGTQCELIKHKMVKERLLQPDAQEDGWLLDGYPRSLSQAKALEDLGFRPDLFILVDVSEESLIERVVGRRLDPVTGRIYHLKYSPPENVEIAARLTQRFDDTEEKVKLRLQTHHQNVEAVLALYKDITFKVDGNAPKEQVFAEIDKALSSVLEKKN